ncbi:hypothetical protein HispidOSU_025919, partial [Sigmodon hispidus]
MQLSVKEIPEARPRDKWKRLEERHSDGSSKESLLITQTIEGWKRIEVSEKAGKKESGKMAVNLPAT